MAAFYEHLRRRRLTQAMAEVPSGRALRKYRTTVLITSTDAIFYAKVRTKAVATNLRMNQQGILSFTIDMLSGCSEARMLQQVDETGVTRLRKERTREKRKLRIRSLWSSNPLTIGLIL